MSSKQQQRLSACACMLVALTLGVTLARASGLFHALTGVISKVDSSAKTLTVKTADGAEHAFQYTDKTAVRDSQVAGHEVKKESVDSYLAGKQGTQVVVRYAEMGSDKVAASVDDYGKEGLKVARGTINHADMAAHTLTIKTDDGGKKTFDVSRDAVVEADHGAVAGAKWSYQEGDQVTVHYASIAGKDIAHFIHKL